MPEDQPSQEHATAEPALPPDQQEPPPPYRPNRELIGYIEKGQKPPEAPRPGIDGGNGPAESDSG